jgi:hypothetical protein
MTDDTRLLNRLTREFDALDRRRRELEDADDDASRFDVSDRWVQCVRQIIAVSSASRTSIRLKARVFRVLLAVDATELALSVAQSLAADIGRRWGP